MPTAIIENKMNDFPFRVYAVKTKRNRKNETDFDDTAGKSRDNDGSQRTGNRTY